MENGLPNYTSGDNAFYRAWNKMLDWCRRNTLQSSSDILVTSTTHGTTLTLARQSRPSVAASVAVSGLNYRGLWTSTVTYAVNDMVSIQTGIASGMYISMIANNSNDPSTGIGWQQFPQTQTVGAWA